MITEARARSVINTLPLGSFLRHYCDYAYGMSQANEVYNLGVGLSLCSVTTPLGLVGRGFLAEETFSNFYTLIVGSSGEAQKSMAIGAGTALLDLAAPHLRGADPASTQALTKSLHLRPTQLFVYEEGGSGLLGGRPGDHTYMLRKKWTKVFDGRHDVAEYADGSLHGAASPRPVLLVGTVPVDLEELTTRSDWQGGFLSRFLLLLAEREREKARAVCDKDLQDWLLRYLTASAAETTPGVCQGMTPEADAVWTPWMRHVVDPSTPERFQGAFSRATLLAAKCAVLISWSKGCGWGGAPWWIDLPTIQTAIGIAELHKESLRGMAPRIAASPDMREQRAVLTAVRARPQGVTLGEICQLAELTKRRCLLHLETLTEQGMVTHLGIIEGVGWYRVVEKVSSAT